MTLLKLNALYLYLFPSIKSAVISPYYLYYIHEKGVKTVIVNNSTIINKNDQRSIPQLRALNTKQTMICADGNPDRGFGQIQIYDRIEPLSEVLTLLLLTIGSHTAI